MPHLLNLCLLLLASTSAMAQQCYKPDGSASTDTPCISNGGDTFCCAQGYVCESNGYCTAPGDPYQRLFRGTCTDKTWSSGVCPKLCPLKNSGVLFPCPNIANTWGCDTNTQQCNGSTINVQLGSYSSLTLIGAAQATVAPPSSSTQAVQPTVVQTPTLATFSIPSSSSSVQASIQPSSQASTSQRSTSSSSSSSSAAQSTSSSSSSSQSLSTFSTVSSTTGTSSASLQSATASGSTSSTTTSVNTTAIAVGVTVPLVVIALLIGAFFLWRSRRTPRELNQKNEPGVAVYY